MINFKSISRNLFLLLLSFCCSAVTFASSPMLKRFNHDQHDLKAFQPNQIKCNSCHNIEPDGEARFKANDNLDKATFQKPLKAICHECHREDDKQYNPILGQRAPKSCYTCHDSFDQIAAIQPQSHQNKFWKSNHGMNARIDTTSCLNCHSNSQCSTCHTQRNDISLKNHMRNFKFFHSIEARLAPQRCDACHSKTYCTQCHIGKKAI